MSSLQSDFVLKARGLGFRRGDRWIFRNLDLEVEPGTFVALVGPSGVGKTSLLSCLCGMLEPSEGEVSLNLPSLPDAPPTDCRSRLGIIFQNLSLIQNANLLVNVHCGRLARYSFIRTLFGFPKELQDEAYAILADLGIARDPYKWVAEMSGGEQQRVAIARALFQQPDVFFADEPVSSLDAYYAGRVLGLLRQEADTHKRTIFCVLHDADLIQRFADVALSLNPDDPSGWRLRTIRQGKKRGGPNA